MKIYGYENCDLKKLLELREVTFEITPKQAKRLGDFFLKCASEMNEPNWEHEHFDGEASSNVIVYRKS